MHEITDDKIIDYINKSNNIAILMHNSPDEDCVGCVSALNIALKKLNKNVEIILQSKINIKYSKIIGKRYINKKYIPNKYYDLAILLDTSDLNRTYNNIINQTNKLIIMDHHEIINYNNNNIYYLNNKDTATAILVFNIINKLQLLDDKICTALYLAIKYDTDNFKILNIDSKTHLITSQLLKYNINFNLIHQLEDNITLSYINLMSTCLVNLKVDSVNHICYLIITYDEIKYCNSNMKEAGKLIDIIKNIENIDISYLLISNYNNQLIIKGRSKQTNLIPIIKSFNGGGHPHAVGCLLNSDDIYITKNKLINKTINSI